MSGQRDQSRRGSEERYASVRAEQRGWALPCRHRRLRSPVADAGRDLPLPKPFKGAILAWKPRASGECRFKIKEKEASYASLSPSDHATLKPISEFATKPDTEDEKRSLAEIIHTFNERHGTQFSEADFLRFEQVNREILDEDMTEMLRNNPPDVVFSAFSQAFFQGAIKMFQRNNEMKNIVLSDPEVRAQAIRHFFGRALRQAREAPPT